MQSIVYGSVLLKDERATKESNSNYVTLSSEVSSMFSPFFGVCGCFLVFLGLSNAMGEASPMLVSKSRRWVSLANWVKSSFLIIPASSSILVARPSSSSTWNCGDYASETSPIQILHKIDILNPSVTPKHFSSLDLVRTIPIQPSTTSWVTMFFFLYLTS